MSGKATEQDIRDAADSIRAIASPNFNAIVNRFLHRKADRILRLLANPRRDEKIVTGEEGTLAVFKPDMMYNAATGEEYTYEDFVLDRKRDSIR